jgi:type II secretory pathway component PulF
MTYPAVMLVVVIGATTILLWKVVPVFAGIFTGRGDGACRCPRSWCSSISEFLQSYIH